MGTCPVVSMKDESSVVVIDNGGGGTDVNRSGTRKSCS
jgi:hypothetical protein